MFVNQMAEVKIKEEHSFYDGYNAFVFVEDGTSHLCLIDDDYDGIVIDNGSYCTVTNEFEVRTVERFISNSFPDAHFVKAFKDNEYQLRFCPLSSPESEPEPEFF